MISPSDDNDHASPSSPSPSPSTPATGPIKRKRRRKVNSCFPCHARKVKCNQERPVCNICRKRGKGDECKWEDTGRFPSDAVPPPVRYLTTKNPGINIDLLAEAAASSDALTPPTVLAPRDFLDIGDEPVLHIKENSAIGYCRNILALNDFSLNDMKNVSLLTDAPSSALQSSDIVLPFFSLPFDSPLSIENYTNEFGMELPPRAKIDQLVNYYLTNVNSIHTLWDPAELFILLDGLLGGTKGDIKTRQYGVVNVLLILAQGARFDKAESLRGREFAQCARRKLLDLGTPVAPLGITAHFLLALYLQESHEYALSFLSLGTAIRSAQLLGFHVLTPTNRHQRLWQCLVRVELAHSFLVGRPSVLTPQYAFDPMSTTSIEQYDPYGALCTFNTFLSQAIRLQNTQPADFASFRLLSSRIKSFAPLTTTSEIFGSVNSAVPPGTSEMEIIMPCIKLYYIVFTRLILVGLMAPFLKSSGYGQGKENEEEALEYAHELIGAASTLHELFPAFIRGSDLVLLGCMASTLVCSVHTLRNPLGDLADRSKVDIMKAQLIFFAAKDTEPLAARGCDVIQRLRRRYYEEGGTTPRNGGTPPPVMLDANGHEPLGHATLLSRSTVSSRAPSRVVSRATSPLHESKEKILNWDFNPSLPIPALDDLIFDWSDDRWLDWLTAADPTSVRNV